MGCMDNEGREGMCAKFFPDDIKDLLKRLACECVIITFENGTREKVKIECVSGDLLVVKEQNMFRFINIECICSVLVNCDTILENLLGTCKGDD
jgi:hypothetical protein